MSYHFCFSLVVAGRWKVQVLLWVHRRLALWRQCELQGRQLNWRVERMMVTQSAKASQTARVWSVCRRLQDLRQDPSPLMSSHRRMQHLFWPDSQGLWSTSFFDVCWSIVYSLFILFKWWCSVRVRGRLGQMALAWLSLTSDLVFQGGTPPRQGTHDSRAVSFMATMAVSCTIQVKTIFSSSHSKFFFRQPWLSLSCKALTTRKCSSCVFPAAILAFRQWYLTG